MLELLINAPDPLNEEVFDQLLMASTSFPEKRLRY